MKRGNVGRLVARAAAALAAVLLAVGPAGAVPSHQQPVALKWGKVLATYDVRMWGGNVTTPPGVRGDHGSVRLVLRPVTQISGTNTANSGALCWSFGRLHGAPRPSGEWLGKRGFHGELLTYFMFGGRGLERRGCQTNIYMGLLRSMIRHPRKWEVEVLVGFYPHVAMGGRL